MLMNVSRREVEVVLSGSHVLSLQYKVRSLQDLVSLKDSDRRIMLRVLGEEKYDEVMAVLGSFPHVTMDTKLQGQSGIIHIQTNTSCVSSPSCSFLFAG